MGRYGGYIGEKCRRTDGGGFRDTNGNGCVEHIFQKEGGAQADVYEWRKEDASGLYHM